MKDIFILIVATIVIFQVLDAVLDALKKKSEKSQELRLRYQNWEIRAETVDELVKKLIRKGDIDLLLTVITEEYNSQVRSAAASALGALLGKINNADTIQSALKAIEDKGWVIRSKVIAALGKVNDSWGIQPLLNFLEDKNANIRAIAATALGEIGDAVNATEPLIKALEDEHTNVRVAVVTALGKIGDPRAVEPLIAVLGDPDPIVRDCAEEALEKIKHSETVESLIQALRNKNPDVRQRAAKILGAIGDARAVEPLIETHNDTDRKVRENVVEALGEFGDVRAIDVLVTALEKWDIQWVAAQVLDNIGWTPTTDVEKAYYFYAKREKDALITLGISAIAPLKKMLRERGSSVARDEIIMALQGIYASIETIIFGHTSFRDFNRRTTLQNPDVSELTMPISALKRVIIQTETSDFHQIERFLTYAVNYIGQKHLKKYVDVHLYGDPEKLHPNLRNNFANLCKRVHVHEEQKVRSS